MTVLFQEKVNNDLAELSLNAIRRAAIKTSHFDVKYQRFLFSADPKIIMLTSATDEVSISFTDFCSSTQAASSGSKTHTI